MCAWPGAARRSPLANDWSQAGNWLVGYALRAAHITRRLTVHTAHQGWLASAGAGPVCGLPGARGSAERQKRRRLWGPGPRGRLDWWPLSLHCMQCSNRAWRLALCSVWARSPKLGGCHRDPSHKPSSRLCGCAAAVARAEKHPPGPKPRKPRRCWRSALSPLNPGIWRNSNTGPEIAIHRNFGQTYCKNTKCR